MAGDGVVHEDHSPLPMRIFVESTAAIISALSVGMQHPLKTDVRLTLIATQNIRELQCHIHTHASRSLFQTDTFLIKSLFFF